MKENTKNLLDIFLIYSKGISLPASIQPLTEKPSFPKIFSELQARSRGRGKPPKILSMMSSVYTLYEYQHLSSFLVNVRGNMSVVFLSCYCDSGGQYYNWHEWWPRYRVDARGHSLFRGNGAYVFLALPAGQSYTFSSFCRWVQWGSYGNGLVWSQQHVPKNG